ncbi:hypothetical protein B0H63DRAFT_315385 [Podospora didyma]|uniref:C2H2-type domain-containing protein n=1 Tax=Podospora didyma TaxID=330526 RepID=A0AAE0K5Q9_9PEZI|nr:hypothetical protein B0H63DRAFT_315385 [Podospora didyma]
MEQGKPRGPGDNGDQRKDGEDNNNSNTNNSGKPPKRKAEVHQRWEQPLSCPFRKRNRQRFNYRLHKSCTNPFKDVQAVKAHVRNWHKLSVEQSSHQCPRCWETFSSKKGLTQHASHPVDQICEPREQPVNNNEPEDGITDKTSNSLVARKGKDKVSSWDDMWNLLFPDDINVPSPDHEPSGIAEVFEYSQVFDELLAHESVVTGLPENMRSVLKGIMDEKLGCLEQRVLLESAASASGRGRSGTATSGNVPERSQSQGPGNIGSFEPPSLQISYATPQRHRQTARHAKRQSISSPKAIAPKVNTSFRNQSSSFYHPGSGSLSAPMTPSPHSGSSMSSFQSIHSLPSLWGDHGVSPTVGDPSALQPPAMPSYSSQPTGFVTNQLQGGQPVMYPGDNPHFPSYYAAPHAAGAGSGGVMAAEAFPNQLGGYHSTLGSWEDLTSSHSLPGPMQPPDQGTE